MYRTQQRRVLLSRVLLSRVFLFRVFLFRVFLFRVFLFWVLFLRVAVGAVAVLFGPVCEPVLASLALLLDDLHRWMRQIGHDGRLFKSASDPVEVHSMAQRLSSEERVRVDEMARAGVDVDEMARRLDRHRSTVHRELKRCGGRCGYDAEAAQAAADLRARRPKTPKLAGDPVLARGCRRAARRQDVAARDLGAAALRGPRHLRGDGLRRLL